ncbi:IS3 family transposase [Rhodococcus sp. WB9]|uniref:IS3 family transposase n=1 Tax=Rhodococcus sp. WB9 TaxID=2594007 RepID=UPI00118490F9|nr:IS3 family transposase [Rhodococcus sp. WB9]QDQ89472.1 IS3 family transposase [Rhodococcus sp. WB9]QDQ93498.1 IS3 family transposase [Rhodococcus sp. WB9]QDQ94072.1 IS3 family transposase [Rhodococcus sp. WB9]
MARTQKSVLIDTVTALHGQAGMPVARASALLGLARSSYYRLAHNYQHYRPVEEPIPHIDRRQPAALSATERRVIIDLLLAEENADRSVVQTYWRSFDAGLVACSERTFDRVARSQNLTGDRRRTRRGGSTARPKPVVAAAQVGQLWSWDITMLQGPRKQDRYLLYLAIDVFSRYPVAWRIEYAETTQLAVLMFAAAFEKFGAPLVLHADNGASMRSTGLLDALESAGVSASYSRPRVSDDNPFSESLFKTLKYDLSCPDRFDSIDHARQWTEQFLHRYATEHRHSGLSRHTPAAVFFGTATETRLHRQDRLDRIWTEYPERFRRRPRAPELPQLTGININHDLSQTG